MAERKSPVKTPEFYLALAVVLIAIIIGVLVYTQRIVFHAPVGPFFLHHWFSWAGALFIAVYTPIYYILKRKNPKKYKTLVRIHVFGNLTAFALITIHFNHHLSRPAITAPEGQTGLIMYIAVITLVITGFLMRFQLLKKQMKPLRFIHTSLISAFYITVVVHILRGLGILI